MNEPLDIRQSVAEKLLKITMNDIAPDTVLCVLIGEIDLLTEPLLRQKLNEAVRNPPRHLVIDFSDVQFMGSTGLRILIEIRSVQQATGRHLALVVGNNRLITRPLQITNLDHDFDLHKELATAVDACRTAEVHGEA